MRHAPEALAKMVAAKMRQPAKRRRQISSMGGKARKLTAKRRREIARLGALARIANIRARQAAEQDEAAVA